jgi:hypothetical protein
MKRLLLVALLALAACDTTSPGVTKVQQTPGKTWEVKINGFTYQLITIPLPGGGTVECLFNGSSAGGQSATTAISCDWSGR